MAEAKDTSGRVRGLGDLEFAAYRVWVRRSLLVALVGYAGIFAMNAAAGLKPASLPGQGLAVVALAGALFLLRRGWLRATVILGTATVWLELISSLPFSGGINDYGYIGLPTVVLIVGLVFGSRAGYLTAAGTAVAAAAMVAFAVATGRVTAPIHAVVYPLLVVTVAMAAMAVVASVAVSAFSMVLDRARDATRRVSELVEHAPDGIVALGGGGVIRAANPAAGRLLDRPPGELESMRLQDVLASLGAESDQSSLSDLFRPTEGGRPRLVWWRKGYRTQWAEVTARSHATEEGVGTQVVLRDVTMRQQAIEEQHAVRERLEEAQRLDAVARLAGGIAHDFRNILTVITNAAELIVEESDGDTRRLAEEIREAAGRASVHTTQLLAYARKEIIQPVELDLAEVLEFMDVGIRHLLGPGVEYRTKVDPALPPILGDRAQVEQVFYNLLRNAADALDGTGRVEVTLTGPGTRRTTQLGSVTEVPPGFAEIRVWDNGPGIEPGLLDHIFEPYFTTKPTGSGTGLGLSTVHGIVNQHGGQIRVESRPGEGTSVEILWPVHRHFRVIPPAHESDPTS